MRLDDLIISAVLACGALAAAPHVAFAQQVQIPEHFRGVWQATQEGTAPSCSAADADIRMTVMLDGVDYHEGECDLLSVHATGGSEREVAMNFMCRSEGEEWKEREVWTLREDDSMPVLMLDRPDRDFPPLVYGRCDAEPEAANVSDSTCYASGNSSLEIKALDDTQVQIDVDSLQQGAHMCSIWGVAETVEGGLRYIEQIDGVGECRLDILIADDRSVRFRDRDSICKRYYCGMNASLEHIEFAPSAEHPC